MFILIHGKMAGGFFVMRKNLLNLFLEKKIKTSETKIL